MKNHFRLQSFLERNPNKINSTKSALLKWKKDILLFLDSKKTVVFVMLDLIVAFDYVGHSIKPGTTSWSSRSCAEGLDPI